MKYLDRAAIEDFLYREAELLDSWQLDEWFALFTDDGFYGIPAPDDAEGAPETSLFVIADNWLNIRDRVTQLLGNHTWSENPRSRTRRMVGNVVIVEQNDVEVVTASNLILHRSRLDKLTVFFARVHHVLVKQDDETLRIKSRKVVLDLESLQSVGKISFIL